ncbi:PTS transporter subunit EIIC [Levilactobacillus angrenensis]|uniref:Permease IIC component n=1 Tax=Levilactobacillus angrenensis TaxID=2486020 RepID=A0ABW1UB25_9LACO|nr:PTS transporter subunit EIIC [Levilactobacillus angrenensis]
MQTTNLFARYLIRVEISWQHNRQITAIRRALRLIFPLVLLGSLADFINQAWLQTDGYYYQTLHVVKWVLRLRLAREYLRLISAGTLGLTAVLMAFAVSFYLVASSTQHTTDRLMAGITAVISLKFFNVNRASVLALRPIKWLSTDLGLTGVLMGILIGLLVGNSYRWCLNRQQADEADLGLTLTVTSGWILGTAALGLLWIGTQTTSVNAIFTSMMRWPFHLPHFIMGLAGFSVLTSLYQWLGLLGPITVGGQSMESAQNLAAVLNHHGWQLPHPVTLHTIVNVYAEFGGSGMLLGLLFAIFLVRGAHQQQRVGWLSLVPTLGNLGAPLMVGVPVILSPLLGIPFLLAPLATISVSWLCVRFAWVPAVAYPLATGTPGPLLAYLGTGGSWSALALALVDLAISTAIYYPFVKWQQVAQVEGGAVHEA